MSVPVNGERGRMQQAIEQHHERLDSIDKTNEKVADEIKFIVVDIGKLQLVTQTIDRRTERMENDQRETIKSSKATLIGLIISIVLIVASFALNHLI